MRKNYNSLIILLIFTVLLSLTSQRELEHECQHEAHQELYERSLIVEDEEEDGEQMRRRQLASE